MGEQSKKPHMNAGLLAHVGASRREPHLKASSPVPKPGFFLFFQCKASVKV